MDKRAAVGTACYKEQRAQDTAMPVENGGLVEEGTPKDEASMAATEPVRESKVPEVISSNHTTLEAARAASKAPSKILDYTPLSSLPSSGSLMRHLFELRRKQQEQRRKLDASIQSASPTLAAGGLQPVTNDTPAVPQPPTQRFGRVGGSVFATSTPQTATVGPLFSSEKSSIPSSLSIETPSRRALSHLPFDINTNSPIVDELLFDDAQTCAKTKKVHNEENHPPDKLSEEHKSNSINLSSHYNPNVYRSPPKKERPSNYDNTLCVAGGPSPSNFVRAICNSSFSASPRINDTSVGVDERPISSSNKSFEELILEKIKAGVFRSSATDTPAPKKCFLRKGSGTARFEPINDSSLMKVNDASRSPQEVSNEQHSETRPNVKFPYLKRGAGTRRFNCRSVKLKKAISRVSATVPLKEFGCEDKLTLEEPFADNFSTPIRSSSLHAKKNVIPTKRDCGGGQLFSPISPYPKRELEELEAFEKLEELADNTSLSSHASTVNSLLQKGLNASASSTPTDSPCPARHRVLGDFSLSKRRQWGNPLQFLDNQANAATSVPQPGALINNHSLDVLAHQVAGVPFKERVLKPNPQQSPLGEQKRARTVQFCERGAQILEYCVSECDTASEAPTASDASEYLNMSDLEALNQLSHERKLPGSCVSARFVAPSPSAVTSNDATVGSDDSVDSVIGTPPHDRSQQPLSAIQSLCLNRRNGYEQAQRSNYPPPRHTVLKFSPPKMPPNAASHAIWEAFGCKPQVGSGKPAKCIANSKPQHSTKASKVSTVDQTHRATDQLLECSDSQSKQDELDAHKVLLVSKVHELEREITTFQMENAQLAKLKDTLHREKEQLSRERKMFEVSVREDRGRMEDYFEKEKRKLWTEKCSMESSKETEVQKSNTLEIINLKEEILLLKRELDRKDSLHNFTQTKLKERIKELDRQNKDLEKKTEKFISLEKENMSLKHQIDRLKLSNKLKPTQRHQSIPKNSEQPTRTPFNKSVRFAVASPSNNVPILDVKSKNRNSSFFSSNFGGSLPDITSESSNKPASSIGSPYDSYLNRIPFSSDTSVPSANTTEQDTITSTDNNSLNCSESVLADGSKVITFANGNKKQVFPSGRIVLEYCNGDWEDTHPGRATVYYYNETGTRQTTHHDSGLEEVEFSDGVTEKRHPDGSVDVSFPDGSRTLRRNDGTEEVRLADGMLVVVAAGGAEKVLHLPNGQREVHGHGFKRREYPDGTAKVLYDDGSTKTTYPGGRVRVKDKDGNLVSDSKHGMDLTSSAVHHSC